MVRFDFRAILILAVISSGALAAPTPMPRASAIELQDLQFSDPAIGGPLAIVNVLEPRGNVVHSSDDLFPISQKRSKAVMYLRKYVEALEQEGEKVEDRYLKESYKELAKSLASLATFLPKMLDWSFENPTNGRYLDAMLRPGNKRGDKLNDRLLDLVDKISNLQTPIDGKSTRKKIEEISKEYEKLEVEFSSISGPPIQREETSGQQ
ncbi:hypothetical protein FB446DRAFT_187669 [Lentinula raphanica]|nr:hypothetical protein FB446DRAFT_187669 [Lentinula raphanica]